MNSNAVPESRFTLSGRTNATVIQKWSSITFLKIRCITAEVDGTTKLVEEEIVRSKIFDEPFSSGTMKHAHDVCFPCLLQFDHLLSRIQLILANGDQFVAKRFVQLSSDAGEYEYQG
jgi:hypothetical protein